MPGTLGFFDLYGKSNARQTRPQQPAVAGASSPLITDRAPLMAWLVLVAMLVVARVVWETAKKG